MLFLIFEKRDIELLEKYIELNMKELLINKSIITSVFANIIEQYLKIDEDNEINIKYFNRVINVFLRGKLYNKLFNDSEEDYLRILKTSPKNFVWELIDKIENELNKEYRWIMYDKDGKETTNVSEAVKITTDYLSKEQGEARMKENTEIKEK